jgi:transcriptional regulator with XRE-family HTH domain
LKVQHGLTTEDLVITEKIALYLDEHGIKQRAVAEYIGVSPSTMTSIISGKRRLSAEEYIGICDFLQVPYSTFVQSTS